MVNPDLSRRVAKAMDIMIELGLGLEDRIKLAGRVEKARTFDDLSEIDRKRILDAEKFITKLNSKLPRYSEIAPFYQKDNKRNLYADQRVHRR